MEARASGERRKRRANAVEMELRVRVVRQLLAGGMGHGRIIEIAGKAWGVKRVQVWRYMRRVYADWQKLVEEESSQLQTFAVWQRNLVFRRALAKREFRAALGALESRDTILGICEPRGGLREKARGRLEELMRESLEEGTVQSAAEEDSHDRDGGLPTGSYFEDEQGESTELDFQL